MTYRRTLEDLRYVFILGFRLNVPAIAHRISCNIPNGFVAALSSSPQICLSSLVMADVREGSRANDFEPDCKCKNDTPGLRNEIKVVSIKILKEGGDCCWLTIGPSDYEIITGVEILEQAIGIVAKHTGESDPLKQFLSTAVFPTILHTDIPRRTSLPSLNVHS